MSMVPWVSHVREVGRREERIAQLEAEVQRLGNIINAQADRLAATKGALRREIARQIVWTRSTE